MVTIKVQDANGNVMEETRKMRDALKLAQQYLYEGLTIIEMKYEQTKRPSGRRGRIDRLLPDESGQIERGNNPAFEINRRKAKGDD